MANNYEMHKKFEKLADQAKTTARKLNPIQIRKEKKYKNNFKFNNYIKKM